MESHLTAHISDHPVRDGLHVICSPWSVQVAKRVAASLSQHLHEASRPR